GRAGAAAPRLPCGRKCDPPPYRSSARRSRDRDRPDRTLRLLSRYRAQSDIAPTETFAPADAIHGAIGARLCLRNRLARCADIEHAPTIGKNASMLRQRAGMKDLDAFDRGGCIESLDD